ncbi:L-seryl-tRNA(Sec) selenium transferase [Alicyclobacillaceae bacterium I2511]|nr:L-seryl-tRNA(Sec) selenium transferase [Alicyclobacillaceae bacterium I2511]
MIFIDKNASLRSLPAVGRLLENPQTLATFADFPLALVSQSLAEALTQLRNLWAQDPGPSELEWAQMTQFASILARAKRVLEAHLSSHLRPVLNLTGTVIHTNLGRAPLSFRALQAVHNVASQYSNLEYDLDVGTRGSRHDHVAKRLCALTGAQSALVVNNNAAAVLLALRALAQGGEAVVSRGQLVEIGGSFRIPDIMAQAGVILKEVGTSNKTHLRDYQQALGENTRLILKVHTSNYRIVGFVHQPALTDLVELARQRQIPLFEDLGSGALFDFPAAGVGDEPTVARSIKAGVDLLSFSGDKLLGGAQAGIILGRQDLVTKLRGHPWMRALRVDKMTLAALEATLTAYEDPELARREVPVVRMITASYQEMAEKVAGLAKAIATDEVLSSVLKIDQVDAVSRIGGGALPLTDLPTRCLQMRARDLTAKELFDQLRTVPPVPIIARIVHDAVVADPRTLLPGQEGMLLDSLRHWAQSKTTALQE